VSLENELYLASGALCGALRPIRGVLSEHFEDPLLEAIYWAGTRGRDVAKAALKTGAKSWEIAGVLWDLSCGVPLLLRWQYEDHARRLMQHARGRAVSRMVGYAMAAQDLAMGLLMAAERELDNEEGV
jgi:hypothetical protein